MATAMSHSCSLKKAWKKIFIIFRLNGIRAKNGDLSFNQNSERKVT